MYRKIGIAAIVLAVTIAILDGDAVPPVMWNLLSVTALAGIAVYTYGQLSFALRIAILVAGAIGAAFALWTWAA
jgi:hypothetical protein